MEPKITGQSTVNEIIRRHPETVAVFNDFGVDACCGGATRLTEAAERDRVSLPDLLDALREAAGVGSA